MSLRLEALGEHDVAEFRCGNDSLDRWIRSAAADAAGQGTRTFVLVDHSADDGARVIGYVAVAPHFVVRTEVARGLARGAPERIPAILLAKLALDESVQGRGLGAELLVRALELIISVSRQAGGRVVVVDAIDDAAAAFYRHHDFEPLPSDPRRLLLRLSTAAKALGLPWP